MKICFLANAASVHTRRWIAPLLDRGYDIHLVSYAPGADSIPGVNLVDLTKITNVPKVRFLVWARWLRRYLANLQPDVLHAHQIQAAGWLGAMSGFHPLVVSSWGSDILVEPHKSAFRRTLVRFVLHASDRLIVPSQLLVRAADDLGYPETRLRFIPWGVEMDIFQPMPMDRRETRRRLHIDPDAKVILSPRGLAPVYNQDVLLNAVGGLIASFPDILLLLLRFNVDRQVAAGLEAKVAALGLDRYVRWLPSQTPAEMAQLDRMADVVASIPSTEGYGFSVYEAMAAGCPTLISDLPVFAAELADGVHTLKVPVQDVNATCRRLAEILGDDTLRQNLRQRAFEVVAGHSVSRRVDEAERLYKELGRRDENRAMIG